jgi:hypothetical protein
MKLVILPILLTITACSFGSWPPRSDLDGHRPPKFEEPIVTPFASE